MFAVIVITILLSCECEDIFSTPLCSVLVLPVEKASVSTSNGNLEAKLQRTSLQWLGGLSSCLRAHVQGWECIFLRAWFRILRHVKGEAFCTDSNPHLTVSVSHPVLYKAAFANARSLHPTHQTKAQLPARNTSYPKEFSGFSVCRTLGPYTTVSILCYHLHNIFL